MSLRRGAPYADHVEEGGEVLIYEGHDIPYVKGGPRPKMADQPLKTPTCKPTQNAFFYEAALRYKRGEGPAEKVRVYEKIRTGVWVYNGLFELVDAWKEESSGRKVFRFKHQLAGEQSVSEVHLELAVPHNRLIPTRLNWQSGKETGVGALSVAVPKTYTSTTTFPIQKGVLLLFQRTFGFSVRGIISRSVTRLSKRLVSVP